MFHPRHYAESRTNSFTFCLAPASPRISRCNHCFGMGVNLVARLRRRHPGMRERAPTLEVRCGLSLVTTAQRFPFYFHPPETVPIAIEQASTPNPTTRRCLSRSGLRGGSLWLERISILYENSHRRRQRMGPTRRLEYLGAEDPLGSLRRSKRRA